MKLAALLLLAAATCGFAQSATPPQALPSPVADPKAACLALRQFVVSPALIGLATVGAEVRSAQLKKTGGHQFCEVLGEILSVDPTAQAIHFEVNLPTDWNGKAVHFGGGGFDGYLQHPDGLRTQEVGVKSEPTPLQRGFATFGGDSGHHHRYDLLPDEVNGIRANFAVNAEERRNFAHEALKKTHDVAVLIMRQRYGIKPVRTYFIGGSTGGREAYFVTQLWPDDYDGVLGAYAGWNQVQLDLQFIRVSQAEYRKGDHDDRGWVPASKTRLVANRVLEACDAEDGLKDGIISHPAACHFDLASLACGAGNDGRNCLSPGELKTMQVFATEQRTARPLYHDVQSIPGFDITSGTDLTGSLGLTSHLFHPPIILLNSFYSVIASGVLRYFLTDDPKYDFMQFDTTTGGEFADKLLPQSIASDASDADLTPFASHGGKLLLLHGTTDATIPTGASVQFYRMMQDKMGPEAVNSFARLYLVPGYGHSRGVFDAGFDSLGTLDRWVELNKPPVWLVATDNNKKEHGRTRPLCAYPTWPRYKAGAVNVASSFECVE